MKKLIIPILSILFLAACSNITDLSDTGYAKITVGESSDGRYIANPSAITSAVLGFVKEDTMFNFADVEDITNWTGEYLFTGIPVGDYSFLAMLMDVTDDIIGMKIQGVTIEPGLNEIVVEMGPGFEVYINDLEFDIEDLGETFTLSLSDNTITIGISSTEFNDYLDIGINLSGSATMSFLKFNGSEISYDGDGFYNPEIVYDYGLGVETGTVRSFMMEMYDGGITTTYKVILKPI